MKYTKVWTISVEENSARMKSIPRQTLSIPFSSRLRVSQSMEDFYRSREDNIQKTD